MTIRLRVTPAEAELWKRLAEDADTSLSEWIRSLCNSVEVVESDPVADAIELAVDAAAMLPLAEQADKVRDAAERFQRRPTKTARNALIIALEQGLHFCRRAAPVSEATAEAVKRASDTLFFL